MGFEMIAARILNPYFGGGIGVWACIISTFLIGSSIGYLIGGKTADGKFNRPFIHLYLFYSGIFVSLTAIFSLFIMDPLSENPSTLHIISACILLFFIPSLLSSSTVPGLMKLGFGETTDSKKIGFYHMLVSLGSVSGTLLTSFLILPHLKMKFILVIFSLIYFICWLLLSFKWYKIFLCILCFLPLIPLSNSTFGGNPIVEEVSSPYQDIYITTTSNYNNVEGDYRMMQFDTRSVQGIINIDDPENPIFSYINGILSLVDVHAPSANDFFMIGHGAGTLTSSIEKRHKNMMVAEIDAQVLDLSRKYFNYRGNSVIIKDGRILLKEKPNKFADTIILDAFKSEGIPFHLLTRDFFEITNKKLRNDGIIILNVIGSIKGDSVTNDTYATLSSIYPNIQVYAQYDNETYAASKQNLLFIASQSPLSSKKITNFDTVTIEKGNVLTDEWIQNKKLQ